MSDYAKIIERVEAVRRDQGLTKQRFASAFGMPPQTYSNFLGVQKSKPSPHLLTGVIEQYGVNPTWLLLGQGLMYTPQDANMDEAGNADESPAENSEPSPQVGDGDVAERIDQLRSRVDRMCATFAQTQIELHELKKRLYGLMARRGK